MIMPRGKNETDAEWLRAYRWPTVFTMAAFAALLPALLLWDYLIG